MHKRYLSFFAKSYFCTYYCQKLVFTHISLCTKFHFFFQKRSRNCIPTWVGSYRALDDKSQLFWLTRYTWAAAFMVPRNGDQWRGRRRRRRKGARKGLRRRKRLVSPDIVDAAAALPTTPARVVTQYSTRRVVNIPRSRPLQTWSSLFLYLYTRAAWRRGGRDSSPRPL